MPSCIFMLVWKEERNKSANPEHNEVERERKKDIINRINVIIFK